MELLQSTKDRIARIAILAAASFIVFAATALVDAGTDSYGWNAQHTLASLRGLTSAVELFYLDTGRIPTQEEGLRVLIERPPENGQGWKGPYFYNDKDVPRDSWGAPYIYKVEDIRQRKFVIYSVGMNGTDDNLGHDDISVGKKLEPCELFAMCPPASEYICRALLMFALILFAAAVLDAGAFIGLLLFRRIKRK